MPARREYTPEELRARLERERGLARERMVRYRRRLGELGSQLERDANPVTVTRSREKGRDANPPRTPPSPPLSLEREIREALQPLKARGYVHDPRFWVLASEQYPLLCLELEALKLADWLQEPRNRKRRCSKAFLDNWLKKAEADRVAAAAAQANGVPSPRGVVTNGTWHPPITQQHNRQPDAPRFLEGELERIDPHQAGREMAARRAIPLPQRLAALKGGKR